MRQPVSERVQGFWLSRGAVLHLELGSPPCLSTELREPGYNFIWREPRQQGAVSGLLGGCACRCRKQISLPPCVPLAPCLGRCKEIVLASRHRGLVESHPKAVTRQEHHMRTQAISNADPMTPSSEQKKQTRLVRFVASANSFLSASQAAFKAFGA